MAELIETRCEDINELDYIKKMNLFDKNEIRDIAKHLNEYEMKIQSHTKCKEDYLRYITYEMDLLKRVKQRKEKLGMTQQSDINSPIIKKVNNLYKKATIKFQDDLRFWMAYMKFRKQLRFFDNISRMIEKMIEVHQDKPECWIIAARWEIEENKNSQKAKQDLLKGLRLHPTSQHLYSDIFQLILSETGSTDSELAVTLERAQVIYQQAFKHIKDVTFIIKLLDIATKHKNTDKLQHHIISDLLKEYSYKPQVWDTMARRELAGLTYDPDEEDDHSMEVDETELNTMRRRISFCNEVYQTAVKRIKTETMWALYINCLTEINQDLSTLPNFKRKIFKNALIQGHQSKKLQDKHYWCWIKLLENDKKDDNLKDKLYEVLCNATDALPHNIDLWKEKLRHLISVNKNDLFITEFDKATKTLGSKALPLWKIKLLYFQAKHPNKVEEIYFAGMKEHPEISRELKPAYIKWVVLTKGIQIARHTYNELSVKPPFCLELHKEMADIELIQPDICKQNARRPHEMATSQFGKTNTEVWINFIEFEIKFGDPSKVTDIHRRAVRTLETTHVDKFISAYNIIQTNANSITTLS
ncbi:U3 small nucleolar RNA-associated protein 6 homolog [Microplitis demolitor]|uniref:U3 small nucleolar RNA-associated protein 6 homolog n=1 Tax=Microplitis demolitor TaxID=69319 RepID=UPI0004CD9FF4|nr:U3 small nucleolar RNA-associated protein 6 homolog [Microplitis demolitor]